MKEIVLITGANGNVARKLAELLSNEYSVRFLTRKKKKENEFEWDIENQTIDANAFTGVSYIIHLAGAGIADERWTKERKKMILSSRVDSSQLILHTLITNNLKIKAFISASGIGYYGAVTTEKIYTEEDKNGNDFLSNVCLEWEKSADNFYTQNISERVIKLRQGIVLSDYSNGPLFKMMQPVKYGLGASLGTGKQYMPWIHIDDLCEIIKYAVSNKEMHGVYNAAAQEQTTYTEFITTIAQVLNKSIFKFNVPKFILKIILGEVTEALTEISRVSITKLTNTGFIFKYPKLKPALENILKK